MTAMPVLKPGDTVGILGGGQLGRMLALAAAELGLKCHIYAPESHSCAFDVVREKTCAPYEDEVALARFADAVNVITYEFENIPASTAKFLKSRRPVLPNPDALEIVQDRLTEKDFVAKLGIGTAGFAAVNSLEELQAAVANLGAPSVLKTRRMGYDGKGQASIKSPGDEADAWDAIGRAPAILEQFVRFEREVSVVAARNAAGEVVAFEPAENLHRDHILHRTRVPAQIPGALGARQAPPARPRRNGQPDRRRGERLAEISRRARRLPARLRQGRSAPRTQDGARHLRLARIARRKFTRPAPAPPDRSAEYASASSAGNARSVAAPCSR